MDHIKTIDSLLDKIEYYYHNQDLADVFEDVREISVIHSFEEIDDVNVLPIHWVVLIDQSIHDGQDDEFISFPDSTVVSNNLFELKTVINIQSIPDDYHYNAITYSCHGGSHNRWWYYNRNDSIAIQIGANQQLNLVLLNYKRVIAVHTRVANDLTGDNGSTRNSMLKY